MEVLSGVCVFISCSCDSLLFERYILRKIDIVLVMGAWMDFVVNLLVEHVRSEPFFFRCVSNVQTKSDNCWPEFWFAEEKTTSCFFRAGHLARKHGMPFNFSHFEFWLTGDTLRHTFFNCGRFTLNPPMLCAWHCGVVLHFFQTVVTSQPIILHVLHKAWPGIPKVCISVVHLPVSRTVFTKRQGLQTPTKRKQLVFS